MAAPPERAKPRRIGLKGAKGRQTPRRGARDSELERLAVEYPDRCGACRAEEVFLLDLYSQNDLQLDAATARRYVANNTTAAAALNPCAAMLEGAGAHTGRLVSVIVPTTVRRRGFHESIYRCFAAQTYEAKELVVLDSSPDASPFFSNIDDARVTYVHDPEGDTATGAKRNRLVDFARGEVIVQFDDDDLYLPAYVARLVRALGDDTALVKLCAWKWYDAAAHTFHWYDSERDKASGFSATFASAGWHSRKWGYGFSYAFRRDAALRLRFPETFLGEDYDFVMRLLAAGERCVALRDDEADSIVLHVMHNDNSSIVAKHATYDAVAFDATFSAPVGATLADLKRRGAFDTELSTSLRLARAQGAA